MAFIATASSSAAFSASPEPASPDDAGQPGRAAQSLLAIVVYAVFAALHEIEVVLGLVDATLAHALSAFTLLGAAAFYGLVRSGLNKRCFNHATVTQAQCLFGVLGATMAYAINGPTRGALLLIFLLILVFGMFALRPAEARLIGVFSLAMLAGAMVWSSHADPVHRPAAVEFVHYLFTMAGVAIVLVLSERLAVMRAVVASQKQQLHDLLDRVHGLAIKDELTGLVNRRHMNSLLELELSRLERGADEMAVALIDIDHFKRINDRHGHHVGDGVLQGFAKAAGEELRASDVFARWGGEEFLLMLPMTPRAVAISALERLRVTIAKQSVSLAYPELSITFSAGVAMHEPGDTVQSIVERADRAMYQAKRHGRDRTIVANSSGGGDGVY